LFTRQGGENYNQTSLIDDFYIRTSNIQSYFSTTNNNFILNSNHMHVHLHIPANTLIARSILLQPPRILNPIPPSNIVKFNTQFLENNSVCINTLITLQTNDTLMNTRWQEACHFLDSLIINITNTVQNTRMTFLIPSLS
jgi:hypothetical protein